MENVTTKLRKHLASEREKISYLDAKGRLGYILRYYWLWILGVGGGLFLLFYILFHAFFTVKDYWFYGMFANTMADAGNGSQLWHDFVEFAGYDTKQKKVEMNASTYFDPSVKGGTNNSYYQMFVAVTEAKDLDVLVMGTEGLRATGATGRLLDLRDDAASAILEKYADRLIWCEPGDETYTWEQESGSATEKISEQEEDQGQGTEKEEGQGPVKDQKQDQGLSEDQEENQKQGLVPVGIDISDSRLVTEYHLYEGDCALGLGAYTQRPESAEAFLEFIFCSSS